MLPRDLGRFDPRRIPWGAIRPGWYLLIAITLYAMVATFSWGRTTRALREARATQLELASELASAADSVAAAPAPAAAAAAGRSAPASATESAAGSTSPEGLWFPVPGASIPADDAHLPGAVREYRQGELQGFDFYGSSSSNGVGSGIPIPYGAPVIAAADGTVRRADLAYEEISQEAWAELLTAVADGASEEQLDDLRGRQVWIDTADGRTLRYAHLSGIDDGIREGAPVYRGQVIGYVGNSGTDNGVNGTTRGARLHFEVWEDDAFFGQGMSTDEIRLAAAELFVGP